MNGIDISQWQGDINLAPYQNGFVIVRGGFWTSVDPWAERNIAKCDALSIPWGLYWYSYALNEEQAREEAAAAAAPKAAVTCPYCGATTTPDASGCCEFCGGAVNG